MVIVYRRDGGLTAGRQAADPLRPRQSSTGSTCGPPRRFNTVPPRRGAQIPTSPDGTAALLSADITERRRVGHDPRPRRRGARARERQRGRPGGQGHRRRGLLGRRDRGIRVDQRHAAAGRVGARVLPADRDLPQPVLPRSSRCWRSRSPRSASRAIGYGLTEIGVTVNGQSSSILSILVLGAGTDYALLLVARYREELRKHEDRHEAMALRHADRRARDPGVGHDRDRRAAVPHGRRAERHRPASGPIGAIGIAVAMLSMLTLLPALLVIFGRRAFWPYIPHFGDEGADATHGGWRRIADRVSARPRRVWVGTVALLLVLSLGLLNFDDGLTTGNSYREDVESVQGQELLSQSFPGGANAPTEVIVPPGAEPCRGARARCSDADGVAAVRASRPRRGGHAAAGRARARPLLHRGLRADRAAARDGQGGGRRRSAGGRRDRGRVRRPRVRGARQPRDRADGAAGGLHRAGAAAAGAGGARAADPHGDPVLRRVPGRRRRGVRRDLRVPRQRPVAAAVRLRLPGGAGHRLQHLPHGARARGDASGTARARA